MKIIKPIIFDAIPKMDTWEPEPQDIIVNNARNVLVMPVSNILQVNSNNLDYFMIRPKKCYNSQIMRDHLCHVINYVEKYYDPDKELLLCISRIKYFIDVVGNYTKEAFLHDVLMYILGPSLQTKIRNLVEYNYNLELTYKNISAPLQYTDEHAKMLLSMSIFMNFVIPLTTHFAHINRITEIDDLLLDVYDMIMSMYGGVDMFSKLFETAHSNVSKTEYKNAILWDKQNIRGKDVVTHSRDSVDNIVLNIMPKYAFERNIVA